MQGSKPKRKYTRKVREVVVEEKKEEVETPEKQRTREEIIREVERLGYDLVKFYIYYEGNDIDTLKFIKEFQMSLDILRIGSQVIICSNEHVESVGLNNSFVAKDKPKQWFDLVLSKDTKLGLLIKERPRTTAEELLEFLMDKSEFKNDFIEYCQI